jgi:hypothetical protein
VRQIAALRPPRTSPPRLQAHICTSVLGVTYLRQPTHELPGDVVSLDPQSHNRVPLQAARRQHPQPAVWVAEERRRRKQQLRPRVVVCVWQRDGVHPCPDRIVLGAIVVVGDREVVHPLEEGVDRGAREDDLVYRSALRGWW